LAPAQRLVAVLGEDHLDASGVEWVDDSGDIKVVCTRVTVPADLAQHTGDVVGTLAVRVPVSDPGDREGNVGCVVAFENDIVDGGETFLGCEDDVAGGAVLVDELDCVGRSQREESR